MIKYMEGRARKDAQPSAAARPDSNVPSGDEDHQAEHKEQK
jgi:hypothetical protein